MSTNATEAIISIRDGDYYTVSPDGSITQGRFPGDRVVGFTKVPGEVHRTWGDVFGQDQFPAEVYDMLVVIESGGKTLTCTQLKTYAERIQYPR